MSAEKVEIQASTRERSWRVSGKGRIRASAGKVENRVRTRKGRIRESVGKVESGQVPDKWDPGEYRKGGIRASTREGFRRVPKKWNLGEYRRRVDPGEYRKR